jgi:hypothetical protein
MTDPQATYGRRRNLTIQALPALIHDPTVQGGVTGLVTAALAACESIRARRNRSLAHRDLELALAASSESLPGMTIGEMENALAALRAVLHRVEGQYGKSPTAYQYVVSNDDVDSAVYYLRKGLQAEEDRHRRLKAGQPLTEDMTPEEDI